MPGLTIGDTIPNLEAESTQGKIKLYDQFGDSWDIIFSHPAHFFGWVLGKWSSGGLALKDIETYNSGCKVDYSILADPNREIIKQLNMVEPDVKDSSGNQVPSRSFHIVGLDKKVKLSFLYLTSTGWNMDEVVRVLESLHKANKHKVAAPANWKLGDPMVILPSVSQDEAKKMFPQGYKTMDLPSKKEYLCFTDV